MTDVRATMDLIDEIGLPAVLRGPVDRFIERIEDLNGPGLEAAIRTDDDLRTLLRLVASSEFAATILSREWAWFVKSLEAGVFDAPPTPYDEDAASFEDAEDARARLRRYRNRAHVQILWRSLSGDDDVRSTMRALSAAADSLIRASVSFAARSLHGRFGDVLDDRGESIPLVVLAMGKLGGRELNFSSDVDLVFLYGAEGETTGPKTLSAHEYFGRLSRDVVRLLDDVTPDGFVYRVDTRLRPFGESGPPVLSIAALEDYLLRHGRSWERYAYVKARAVLPGSDSVVVQELQSDIIEPFVYRRYLDYGVFESLRDMKTMIETEVRKRELQDNVKLGPGGIREIEFIAQSLQLVRGGADSQLRHRSLHDALAALGRNRVISQDVVDQMTGAYDFLRRYENAVQAIRDQQTHDVPKDESDRARLTVAMGYDDWSVLDTDLGRHRERVAEQFAEVAFRGEDAETDAVASDGLTDRWRTRSVDDWRMVLTERGFDEPADVAQAVSDFASGSFHRQVDATGEKRLDRFMQRLLPLVRERSAPGQVVERVLSVIARVVRRSAYVALLNENPAVLDRLVDLCEQSRYLASELQRYPILLDELLDPRVFSEHLTAALMREDLAARMRSVDRKDSEAVIETLARFQRATLFRIAVADVSGNLPIMKVSDRLTELAEIVLHEALSVAWQDLVDRHGAPTYIAGGSLRRAGFGVVAYGKLGGMELSYGSDLDLVFLHNSRGTRQESGGEKPLDNSLFFGRLVRRLVHFLTAQTSSGALYEIDTRLRPSGQSGLLVVGVEGFAKYQEDNAWTWEHQALLRSRPVAGSARVARAFEQIRHETLTSRVHADSLLDDVLSMRSKMRKSLDKSGGDDFDLKQGEGGIGDIEFLVQYLVLRHASRRPELIFYPDNIRQLGVLAATGILDRATAERLQETYRVYRLRTHRLALDDLPPLVAGDEFEEARAFVRSVWSAELK